MVRFLASIAFLVLAALPLKAESLSEADKRAVSDVITKQLNAFAANNATEAYSYAAPLIQNIFPEPDSFMAMVKKGYDPVYSHQSFEFGESFTDPSGRPAQRVTLTASDGSKYEAVYTMEKQPDGSWKIAGCYLAKLPETNA